MHRLLFVGLLVGCGTRTDLALDSVADAASQAVIGCPNTPPPAGASCGPNTFACWYFTGDPNPDCPKNWSCIAGAFQAPRNDCLFGRSLCEEGRSCIFFEARAPNNSSSRCVVPCERSCRCDAATDTLKCDALSCP